MGVTFGRLESFLTMYPHVSSTLSLGVPADVPHMRESVLTPRNICHHRLPPAPAPSTEGVLLPLVGLGFTAVIPLEFSSHKRSRHPSDFAYVPPHHPPVPEEHAANVVPFRQVRREHRLRFQHVEPPLLRSHL